jgi:uncharacterized protein YraI
MRLRTALVAALLLAPTAALAAPGIVTVSTGLRAGPGAGFPLVDRIPEGARVNIHGCLRGNAWCDVSFYDGRGWVSAEYLEYLYRNHYVYLPDYADAIDVPVVPFVLSSYWSDYYQGRPWYRRHAYWDNYWSSHEGAASRMTLDPRAARIGRAATREATVALGRDARGPQGKAAISGREAATARHDAAMARGNAATTKGTAAIANERRAAVQGHNPRDAQARMMHDQAASHATVSHAAASRAAPRAQPMARMHEAPHAPAAPRVSAAPIARPAPHLAQPNISHGAPMNAHAQMPAPRPAAPAAMPHPGGGAPAAAPYPGGGPGGPGGHPKH